MFLMIHIFLFVLAYTLPDRLVTMDADIYQLPGNDVDMDIDLPILGDDLPEGEAFPTARHDDDHIEVIQSTSTVSAPMRKKRRTARVLPIDSRMELRHKDLADWNADYLQNMDAIIKAKKHARIAQQAKKNAEYFVWGRGLGGVAQHYANGTGPNPFEMFIGDNLFELATGISRKKGTKHSRDSGIDEATQNEARRVRQRTSEREEEMGRGDEDEGFFQPGGDEVEMPREAATALDDQQIFSSMPWNMSASKHGSSAVPRSARLGMTDQARPGSRPGSRMVSASPLLGRSQALGLEALRSLESDGDVALSGDEFAGPGPSSPPTVVPSPVKPSGRINEALSAEDANFLDFVNDAIVEKRDRAQANLNHRTDVAQATEIDIVTFEELLPPVENNKMVACQGLMMVLLLGTKGMLDVQQLGDFGDINLKLTLQAKASQVVEISDDEVSDSDDNQSDGDVDMSQEEVAEEVGEGHFDEQFAAGHAAQEQRDDDDSLYDN
jgi:meiotic recombination protein REC8